MNNCQLPRGKDGIEKFHLNQTVTDWEELGPALGGGHQ